MYSYLNGILAEKTPDSVVIDCGGVGYELKIPLSTFELLPAQDEQVKLFVFTYQNDDGIRLFGFYKKQEKELFKLLININKIGPKTALALMSSISIKELITAIISQNFMTLTKAPGMGKKTAERLIVELKDKIEDISALDDSDKQTHTPEQSEINSLGMNTDQWTEVESALSQLGFKQFEIRKALQSTKINNKSNTSEIVKDCIKFIYLKRNEA